jgi:hypothetical protein
VTELQPLLTLTGVSTQTDQETVDHNVNLNLSARLGPRTVVGYDLFYRLRKQEFAFVDATDERSEMANGLSLRHTFNRIFATTARVLRNDTRVNDDQTVDYTYSASLQANYFSTFNQTLTFSGTRNELEEGTGTNHSLFLRSNTILYRGWSAFLDLGVSRDEAVGADLENSEIVRFGTNLRPHRTLTIDLDASLRAIQRPDSPEDDFTQKDYNLQAFFVPFRSLSLFGKISIRDREDRTTSVQNYSINWSPFPDGAMQFTLFFSEVLRPNEDRKDRSFGPAFNWTISRHLLFESQYTFSNAESETQEVDSRTFRTELIFTW